MANTDVYVGKDVTVEIYSSDCASSQYTVACAQEVRISPNCDVEGVDCLGSDLISVWAPGLRTYEGSLMQLLVSKSQQLDLLAPFRAASALTEYCMKLSWDTGVADQDIEITFTGVIFPSGVIASPKNAKIILEMPFRAKAASITQT